MELPALELDVLRALSRGAVTAGRVSFVGDATRVSDVALATDERPETDAATEGRRAAAVAGRDVVVVVVVLGGLDAAVREAGRVVEGLGGGAIGVGDCVRAS